MKGWTEEEIRNRDLMAPCGLYCGACGVYIATRDGNEKFRTVMGNLYGTKPEETACLGCMQPDPPNKMYGYCRECKIRECVTSKGYYSAKQRVARLLLRLVRDDNNSECLLFSREDMGAMLGITTETASRAIAGFKRKSLLVDTVYRTKFFYGSN